MAFRALLGHSPSAALWIDKVTQDEAHRVVSSRILRTELTPVLRREGLPVARRDELLDVMALVPVTEGVMAAALGYRTHDPVQEI